MHPIERIRALARASYLDPQLIAIEAADAIADTSVWEGDAAAVSVARRLLAWHSFVGPLWYAAARTLHAVDPTTAACEIAEELGSDATGSALEAALGADMRVVTAGRGWGIDNMDSGAHLRPAGVVCREIENADVLVVGAQVLGPSGLIAESPAAALVDAAVDVDVAVWAVAGRGCAVDNRLWKRLVELVSSGRTGPQSNIVSRAWWDFDEASGSVPARDLDVIESRQIDHVVGDGGLCNFGEAALRASTTPVELIDAASADAY